MIFLPGVDELDDVLAIRKQVVDILKQGGQEVSQWNSDSVSVTKVRAMKLERILAECNEFLQTVDPSTYGRRFRRASPYYMGIA
jgi:hypothetical protein